MQNYCTQRLKLLEILLAIPARTGLDRERYGSCAGQCVQICSALSANCDGVAMPDAK